MSRSTWVAAVAVAGALASPGAALADPVFAFMKAGGTADTMLADEAVCDRQAQKVGMTGVSAGYVPNPIGMAASLALTSAVAGYHRGHVQQIVTEACMREMGYAKVMFTPAEAAEVGALHGKEASKAWADAFYARDWSDRISAASKPAASPLPAYTAEPFVIGGVRIDPARLTVADGEVKSGGLLMSGPVEHAHTALLAKPFGPQDNPKVQATVGAIFYRLDYRPDPLSGQGAGASGVWCGPYRKDDPKGPDMSAPFCIWSLFDGYHHTLAMGPGWLKSAYGFMGEPHPLPAKFGDLVLAPSERDLIGPMDFALNFDQFDPGGASLYATARRDGKSVTFWRATLKFDRSNQAELPFWTRRLLLTRHIGRLYDTLQVQFLPDGDGRGWNDAGQPRPAPTVALAAPPAAAAVVK